MKLNTMMLLFIATLLISIFLKQTSDIIYYTLLGGIGIAIWIGAPGLNGWNSNIYYGMALISVISITIYTPGLNTKWPFTYFVLLIAIVFLEISETIRPPMILKSVHPLLLREGIFIPFFEELIFRNLLQFQLRANPGVDFWIIIANVGFFAFAHFVGDTRSFGDLSSYFGFGLIFAIGYILTGYNTWGSIIMHCMANLTSILIGANNVKNRNPNYTIFSIVGGSQTIDPLAGENRDQTHIAPLIPHFSKIRLYGTILRVRSQYCGDSLNLVMKVTLSKFPIFYYQGLIGTPYPLKRTSFKKSYW